ncbi:ribonuclease R [Candidatus Mycoplasma haematolamae str. Purdue]|uniref:Ribonuclease R n=1 Tax=Mycoplasma haematolamae (strain Purdue) TaxID=1212765 RepID=I7CG89_MYCHA|nr:hypothetical protein [Candidatus Mycoplasma haematolamae]AFO52271.1 ribonuclease R [Candidatus Mycoplasma haematolamae str. Purdue]
MEKDLTSNTPKVDKTSLSEKQLREIVIHLLAIDPRPVPFVVLKSKFYRYIRSNHPSDFITDKTFVDTLSSLKREYLIGENQWGKWFIDYLDYQPNGNYGVGILDIDEGSGNGFITIKEGGEKYKKSSHFVHKKNLNGAKKDDLVKFVELETTSKKKRVSKFSLIDAQVVEILENT